MVEDGYEFFARRHLVTLFSAPNYCGEFDNAGAMMSVDDTLMCSFQVKPDGPIGVDRRGVRWRAVACVPARIFTRCRRSIFVFFGRAPFAGQDSTAPWQD